MTHMAMLVLSPGGPEAMQWTAVETPEPGTGEVRIAQRAVGVNFIDTYYRRGSYAWPATPLIPGGEGAGVVEALGPGVTRFAVGDRIAYTMPYGAYQERRVLPAERLVRLPDAVSFDMAASVMLKGLTAQYLVTSTYAVQRGDTVLVHAAAGGVGLLLGQWLQSLGAVAIGTAGSADKLALARANGYTHLINYRTEDFVAKVHELTSGRGCAVVYDSVGNDTWRGSLKCLRRRGMFVSFGQSSGAIEGFKLADLAAGGSLFASRPTLFDYIASRADLESRAADLFVRIERGTLRTHIGQRFALRDAADAHRLLEARGTSGATILVP
jgi:NADPH2:quinone reductase